MKHLTPYDMHGKGPKGKDLSVFVRFGGVNLKPQKGYSKKDSTFHSPPAPRGFYAFPKVAQEFFLVGSMDTFQPSASPKEPKQKGQEEIDWDEYGQRRRNALSAMRKEFRKTEGNIWSHLGEYVKRSEIIDEHGSWVKTSIKEWQRAFSKMSIKHRMDSLEFMGDDETRKNINSIGGNAVTGFYSRDHCEVFFDEKV